MHNHRLRRVQIGIAILLTALTMALPGSYPAPLEMSLARRAQFVLWADIRRAGKCYSTIRSSNR